MTADQLWLFDQDAPGCRECGEPLPAFQDPEWEYCSYECLGQHNKNLQKELAKTVDKVPTSLYRYFDRDGVLLYVGITGRGSTRNIEHNKSKSWWQFVDKQIVEHHRSRASALQRETALIRKFAPPFNKQQNPDYEAARDAYFLRQSIGGAEGVKMLVEAKNCIPAFVVNKVGNRVTLMSSNPLVVFPTDKIVVESGGRGAKFLDTGSFVDGSGSWARISTVKPEQLKGGIFIYKMGTKNCFPVKHVKLIYQEDGLVNVWDTSKKKRPR